MTNELVTAEDNKAIATAAVMGALMDDAASDSRDIVLPKILLMQGLSDLVAEGKAAMGEFRGSLDNNLLGGKDATIDVIPFYINKSWILLEKRGQKFEYTGQVPFSAANANWEWNATVEGKEVRRDQSINVYCVLPSEIQAGVFMPYLISFRRTSYTAGKKLVTIKEKLKMFNRPLASVVVSLGCHLEKNEQGSFYVFDVSQGRNTTEDEMLAVGPWFKLVKESSVKVDDSDLTKEAQPSYDTTATSDYRF
jgi:hypothetical protein